MVRTIICYLGGVPDGLTADQSRGHLYWTNMGRRSKKPDGFIERADFDGRSPESLGSDEMVDRQCADWPRRAIGIAGQKITEKLRGSFVPINNERRA